MFGELLKRYRMAAGLTQEELAGRAGLSVRGISDLERGLRRVPRKDTIELLVEALRLAAPDHARLLAAARRSRTSAPPLPIEDLPGSVFPPLVGRTRELALLEQHLVSGTPPMVLLAGEPGIGKTRLLAETVQRAGSQGLAVLWGGCQRRGGQEPYAPLPEALARYVYQQPPAQRRAALRGCAWLVRLLPELATLGIEPPPSWKLSPEQERRLLFGAVARLLTNVAGPAGMLLVLDDLQWAGADALDLLDTLVRSAAGIPLRVLGAYRDTEVQPRDPLATALADWAHAGLMRQVRLGSLAPAEAALLLDSLLAGVAQEDAVLEALRRAEGVPFFLVSYAQGLRTGAQDAGAAGGIPGDVAQSIRQRVAALPPAAQDLLGAAAIVGRSIEWAILVLAAAQSRQDEGAVLAALDAACQARLLLETGDEAYQFAHDLIREVVAHDLGAARRAVWHRRVAAALEQAPGEAPVERLAYHSMRAGNLEQAVVYLERAGDHAMMLRATAMARDYYGELIVQLGRLQRPHVAAHAREKLGMVLLTTARYDEALTTLNQAIEWYRAAGDREGLRRATAALGQVFAEMGTPQTGSAQLEALLGTPEDSEEQVPSPGLVALHSALAQLSFGTGQYRQQLAAAERAVALAQAVADEGLLTQAEYQRGLGLTMLGRCSEAQQALVEVRTRAERLGDLVILERALNVVGALERFQGAFTQSRRTFMRALELAQEWEDAAQLVLLLANLGELAIFTGAWSQARPDLERAVNLSQQIGSAWTAVYPLLSLGRLCLYQGAWEVGSQYLEKALALAEQSGDLQALRQAQARLAERDLLQGNPGAACTRLVPLLDRSGLEEVDVTLLLPLLAWAYLVSGEAARAEDLVRQTIARARAQRSQIALVDALQVLALLATQQGRWAEAEGALTEALALARAMPYPYAEARLLAAYGLLHAQKGETARARERLAAAQAIFQRLGARQDSARMEQALAELERKRNPLTENLA
jgi:tetratricopeptide (TPR) repeat protein/transcriptional regulator with XRE-family HTH domain